MSHDLLVKRFFKSWQLHSNDFLAATFTTLPKIAVVFNPSGVNEENVEKHDNGLLGFTISGRLSYSNVYYVP